MDQETALVSEGPGREAFSKAGETWSPVNLRACVCCPVCLAGSPPSSPQDSLSVSSNASLQASPRAPPSPWRAPSGPRSLSYIFPLSDVHSYHSLKLLDTFLLILYFLFIYIEPIDHKIIQPFKVYNSVRFLKKIICLFIFRDGVEGGERGRKTCERETLIGWLTYMSHLGSGPATWACALTGERNRRPSALQGDAQATEPHWPGLQWFIRYSQSRAASSLSNPRALPSPGPMPICSQSSLSPSPQAL